ncbi:MAG: 4-hydroxy-tetrahydrodipicolinate synthase [Alphaproteobacteria bacterium]|nr:4-hydroxy-tetrahydrodipicolinate synthase [Alphaproteobacteria bacterium]
MFQGVFTALVTPFKQGEVDLEAFQNLIEWQIEQGVQGFVFIGTTGEAPTLTAEEYKRVLKVGLETVKRRVPVIAGTGTNATAATIEKTRYAKELGYDAALITMPYYNKPAQEGLRRHFVAIHEAVDIPLIIYNIPGRSVVDMNMATMSELARLKNIVGVKDATNDLARPLQTRLACGKDFCLLGGENATFAAYLAQGGDGGILVTSNVAPRAMRELFEAWKARDIEKFQRLNELLFPLHEAMFAETNPAPAKYALSKLGKCQNELRLPLCENSPAACQKMDAALQRVKDAGYL